MVWDTQKGHPKTGVHNDHFIKKPTSPTETLLHLASCFYGNVIVADTAGLDIGMLYKNSLDLMFLNWGKR